MGPPRQRLEGREPQATWSLQEAPRGRSLLPRGLCREHVLIPPDVQLQPLNCDRIKSCCSSPPSPPGRGPLFQQPHTLIQPTTLSLQLRPEPGALAALPSALTVTVGKADDDGLQTLTESQRGHKGSGTGPLQREVGELT